MQSDGVDIPTASDIAEELWDQFEDEIEDGLDEVVESGIELVFGTLQTEITDWLADLFELFFGPMVGTPAIVGPSSTAPVDIAFREAQGWWSPLISDVYFDAIVPLALALQFIAWAIVGVRYKAINPVVREKLARRLLVAFLALFFWLPIASLSTQFFDALGRQIVLTGFPDQTSSTVGDLIATDTYFDNLTFGAFLILTPIAAYVYLKSLFIFIARWVMVILLTIAMPLVASFWALEVWPFNRFAGLSKQIAGAYPGLLAAGLPAAVLLRIGLEAGGSASSISFGLGSSLAFAISIVIVYLAAKSQKIMIRRSSRVSMQVGEQVLAGAKKPAKIGGAAAAVATTAGVGSVAGTSAAMATGGAINTTANVAKGRPGRAARSVQLLHRDLSNISRADSDSDSESSTSSASSSDSAGQTQSEPGGPQSGGTNLRTATTSTPRSGTTRGEGTNSTTTSSHGRLPGDGDVSSHRSADWQDRVTYWDVVDSDVTVQDPPFDSDDAQWVSSTVEDADDDDTMSAAPAASSDDDPPDEAGAGQTDPSFEDIFAGGDDPLGPSAYRDTSDTDGS